jgi:predicted HicB family RNase H-like nuclease
MKYKGYTGIVELDDESGTLFGRVIGLRDVITFQGESVAEIVQAFHDSVDDYLEFCAQRGESPERPYSGQFVLRIDPSLHREMASAAEAQDVSLNSLVESALKKTFLTPAPDVTPKTPRATTTKLAPEAGIKTVPSRKSTSKTPKTQQSNKTRKQ